MLHKFLTQNISRESLKKVTEQMFCRIRKYLPINFEPIAGRSPNYFATFCDRVTNLCKHSLRLGINLRCPYVQQVNNAGKIVPLIKIFPRPLSILARRQPCEALQDCSLCDTQDRETLQIKLGTADKR